MLSAVELVSTEDFPELLKVCQYPGAKITLCVNETERF